MRTFEMCCHEQSWTEESLLIAMLERDSRAWREFERRYDRLIHRCIQKVITRFSSSLGSEDAEEVRAQFLLSLTRRDMQKLRSFDPSRGLKLSSWIGLLAANAAWDYMRTVAREPSYSDFSAAESLAELDPDPFERLLHKERWNRIGQTLRAFSPKDRTFVHLYYVDGLSPEEVASAMEISVKTVYSKKHKIRLRLRKLLRGVAEHAA